MPTLMGLSVGVALPAWRKGLPPRRNAGAGGEKTASSCPAWYVSDEEGIATLLGRSTGEPFTPG
jgi:hypothetical protein